MIDALTKIPELHGFQTEYVMVDNPTRFTVDVAWPRHKVCLEVDGPVHFVADSVAANVALAVACESTQIQAARAAGERPMAGLQPAEYKLRPSDAIKRELLTKFGWRVIGLPCYAWNDLHSSEEKTAHLRGLLCDALSKK